MLTIYLRGGIAQAAVTDESVEPATVRIVDFDVEGADNPGSEIDGEPCWVYWTDVAFDLEQSHKVDTAERMRDALERQRESDRWSVIEE